MQNSFFDILAFSTDWLRHNMICVYMYVYMCICEYGHDITYTRSLKHPQPGRIATVNSVSPRFGRSGRSDGLMGNILVYTDWSSFSNHFPTILAILVSLCARRPRRLPWNPWVSSSLRPAHVTRTMASNARGSRSLFHWIIPIKSQLQMDSH